MFRLSSLLSKPGWRVWAIVLGASLVLFLLISLIAGMTARWPGLLHPTFLGSSPGNRTVVQCSPGAVANSADQPGLQGKTGIGTIALPNTNILLALSLLMSLILVALKPGLALPLLVIATALNRYRFQFFSIGIRPEHIALLAASFVFIRLLMIRRVRFGVGLIDLIFGLYLLLASLSSVLNAPYLFESFKFIGLMAVAFVIFLLTGSLITNASAFRSAVILLLMVGAVEATFGILVWIIFPLGINLGGLLYPFVVDTAQGQSLAHTISPYGTLLEPGIFGNYVMACSLIFATFAISPELAAKRRWFLIGFILSILALLLSFARGAWIGFLVGGVVWFLVVGAARSRLLQRASLAFVVCLGIFLIVVAFLNVRSIPASPLTVLTNRLFASESVNCRLNSYERAIADWSKNPWLGNGANVFAQHYYVLNQHTPDWISNVELMTLHDSGIVGLGVLSLWCVWVGWGVVKAVRTAPHGFVRTALLGLSVSFIALLTAYQITSAFWLGFTWVHLGLMRAGTLILQHHDDTSAS